MNRCDVVFGPGLRGGVGSVILIDDDGIVGQFELLFGNGMVEHHLHGFALAVEARPVDDDAQGNSFVEADRLVFDFPDLAGETGDGVVTVFDPFHLFDQIDAFVGEIFALGDGEVEGTVASFINRMVVVIHGVDRAVVLLAHRMAVMGFVVVAGLHFGRVLFLDFARPPSVEDQTGNSGRMGGKSPAVAGGVDVVIDDSRLDGIAFENFFCPEGLGTGEQCDQSDFRIYTFSHFYIPKQIVNNYSIGY